MDFKVKGHSKYKLKLENNLVTKYHYKDDDRLVASANKQTEFISKYFKTPKVLDIQSNKFEMEYISGYSFSQFLTSASKRDLDGFINKIDGYLKENIIGELNVPIQLFINKIKSIDFNSDLLLSKIKHKKDIKIKVGLSHGDMTLSNMIFAEDIYLIDFLDSYIESPTMDIIKLRQDTHLYWSLNMVNDITDLTKIKLGLKYIDNFLLNNYNVEEYYFLQIINLIRIFPYTIDKETEDWLTKNINELCEHL